MKVHVEFSRRDVDFVKQLKNDSKGDDFVKHRIRRNVKKQRLKLTPSRCWHAYLLCLLTTQQRSGPRSNVYKFLSAKPFSLNLSTIKKKRQPEAYIKKVLAQSRGIRRGDTIAKQAGKNIERFTGSKWKELSSKLEGLASSGGYRKERELARWLGDKKRFDGLGPKQSRNFLQCLGLTRYEIPIDSRITKRLREDFDFPLAISSATLSDPEHYAFVNDVIRDLCRKANIYPCVFDAILFSKGDGSDWNGVEPLF